MEKLALQVGMYLMMAFGIMQMVSPGTLLEQYKLDISSVSNVEKSNIFNMMSTQGWNLFSSAALASITIRKNDPNTVSAMLFMNMILYTLYAAHAYFTALPVAATWGMPLEGMYFNIALFFGLGVFNFMAWKKTGGNIPKTGNPPMEMRYHALRVSYALNIFFGLAVYFATDKLMETYNVDTAGSSMYKSMLPFFVKEFGFSLASVGFGMMAIISQKDDDMIYALNRFFGYASLVMFMVLCGQKNYYIATSQENQIGGINFNLVLYTVTFVLNLQAMLNVDVGKMKED